MASVRRYAAVAVDDPQVAKLAVGLDVHEAADVDDPAAVGGDVRIGGELEREDVGQAEPPVVDLGLFRGGSAAGRNQDEKQNGDAQRRHGVLHGGWFAVAQAACVSKSRATLCGTDAKAA